MTPWNLGPWGDIAAPLYLLLLLLIGWRSRRKWSTANDYLNASGALPAWAAALSFLAFNCGSIEVIGMSAVAAQYGVQALHFYWIGGIPGLMFMALVVLPVYLRTGARSLPQYLGIRFGQRVRMLNACLCLISTAGFAGVALYALAQVLYVATGLNFAIGSLVASVAVLAYVLLGGIRATIFTSIFQFVLLVAGLLPLLLATVHFHVAGFSQRPDRWHLWKPLPLYAPHAPLDCIGVVLGLGFVISFSYWSADFVMIQRALTARTAEAARSVPLLAGFGKMIFALLVVLPGVTAPTLLRGAQAVPFDQTMMALMSFAFGPALLAFGAAALIASLMAGLAGNVSGFSALWTEEIYRSQLCKGRSEQHYIRTGRAAVVVCLLLAMLTAYATFCFRDLMELLQLIVALFYAPVFAGVLAGVVSRRTSGEGALAGILLGVISALLLQLAFWAGVVPFGSQMTANFYTAIVSFAVAMLACMTWKREKRKRAGTGREAAAGEFPKALEMRLTPALLALSVTLAAICLILNLVWW